MFTKMTFCRGLQNFSKTVQLANNIDKFNVFKTVRVLGLVLRKNYNKEVAHAKKAVVTLQ